MSEHQKGLLSYYKPKKSDRMFANLVTGKSKFAKKSFRKSSATASTSAATTSAAADPTTAFTASTTPTTTTPTRQTRQTRQTTPTTPPDVEEAIASLSSPARKKRRTTTGTEEITEHSDGNISNSFENILQYTSNFKINILYLDDAPLTHKDGKVFLNKFENLEKQISDLRRMMEDSETIISSDYTHHKDFINVSIFIIKFFLNKFY